MKSIKYYWSNLKKDFKKNKKSYLDWSIPCSLIYFILSIIVYFSFFMEYHLKYLQKFILLFFIFPAKYTQIFLKLFYFPNFLELIFMILAQLVVGFMIGILIRYLFLKLFKTK